MSMGKFNNIAVGDYVYTHETHSIKRHYKANVFPLNTYVKHKVVRVTKTQFAVEDGTRFTKAYGYQISVEHSKKLVAYHEGEKPSLFDLPACDENVISQDLIDAHNKKLGVIRKVNGSPPVSVPLYDIKDVDTAYAFAEKVLDLLNEIKTLIKK